MSDATVSDPILYDVDGHVATITTNRPERYNSLNYEAYRLLTEYFAQADADPQVRAIIWTGNGRGFCTGDDVKELLGEGADELARRIASGELELPSGPMLRSETPIIAAVNGGEHGEQYQVGEMDPAELDRWTVFDVEPTVEDWLGWEAQAAVGGKFTKQNLLG